MFREYDEVKLLRDLPEQNLFAGEIGVVLIIYNEPGLPRAYEVDFSDYVGGILKIVTLYQEDIERVEEVK